MVMAVPRDTYSIGLLSPKTIFQKKSVILTQY